jgi:hypothetical protein
MCCTTELSATLITEMVCLPVKTNKQFTIMEHGAWSMERDHTARTNNNNIIVIIILNK